MSKAHESIVKHVFTAPEEGCKSHTWMMSYECISFTELKHFCLANMFKARLIEHCVFLMVFQLSIRMISSCSWNGWLKLLL